MGGGGLRVVHMYDIVQSITTSMGLKERDNGRDSALYVLDKADDV